MPKIIALAGASAAAAPGTVTAPVALTSGVIPKASGAATLVDSAITEGASTLTTTKRVLLPSGTANLPAIDFASDPGTGIYDNGGELRFQNSGAGFLLTIGPNGIVIPNGGSPANQFGFATNPNSTPDASISRASANTINIGNNGGSPDASGTLNVSRINVGTRINVNTIGTVSGGLTLATGDTFSSIAFAPGGNTAFQVTNNGASMQSPVKFTNYNSINLVDNGLPSEVGHLDLTAQTAAIAATTIFTPAATGRFRISVYEKVTTAASVSSVLGGATGTVLTFNDGTDNVAQSITMGLDNQGGTLAIFNNGNATTTSLNGSAYIYAASGVAIQIAVGYTSTGTAMEFAVRATCEAL